MLIELNGSHAAANFDDIESTMVTTKRRRTFFGFTFDDVTSDARRNKTRLLAREIRHVRELDYFGTYFQFVIRGTKFGPENARRPKEKNSRTGAHKERNKPVDLHFSLFLFSITNTKKSFLSTFLSYLQYKDLPFLYIIF